MFYETFGLSESPFQLTPDSRYLFLSKVHKRAKAYMDYTVRKRDGFIVITGEIGAGKTTLINKLLSEIGDDIEVIRVFQTQLDETEFLQSMLFEVGVAASEIHGLGKVELLNRLNNYLIETYSKGKHVVLIVDEGQNLSAKVLEEIRLLSGLELEKEKLLNIILVGQPEMNLILDQPNMIQLISRVRLRFHVGSLKLMETINYIMHRLKVAGAKRPEKIFHADTFPIIQEYTGGIPRRINILCDTALVCAFAENKSKITVEAVTDAIAELQWKPVSDVKSLTSDGGKGANSTNSELNSIPGFNVDGQQWGDVFSSLIKVMGDVTERMGSIDKRLEVIEKKLNQYESNDGKSGVSSFRNGKRWSS